MSQLGTILNYILGVYCIFFGIGLVITNMMQSPIPYYVLMQNLQNMDCVIAEVIVAARVLGLRDFPQEAVSNCSWNEEQVLPNRPLCAWISSGVEAARVRNNSYHTGNTTLILMEDGTPDYSFVPNYQLKWMLGNYSKGMVYRYNLLKQESFL